MTIRFFEEDRVKLSVKKMSIVMIIVNIVFWLGIFLYYSFVKYPMVEDYIILKIFLLFEPMIFMGMLFGYIKKNKWIYVCSVIFLAFNSILSITDQVGLLDVISLVLSVIVFILLIMQWSSFMVDRKQ